MFAKEDGDVPDSIWLRPERAARGPAPEHSREEIAGTAIGIADAQGLPAVTMRAVAGALGSGPASLYRYVASRDELLELMVNEVHGELDYARLGSGDWLADLLVLAHESRAGYLRHPWMIELASTRVAVGPRAMDFLEHALAAMSTLDVAAVTKLETVGLLGGMVVMLTRAELGDQQSPEVQQARAAYVGAVAAEGRHPHLAAVVVAAASGPAAPTEPLFDRVITRMLTGLLRAEG
ncbi:TetR/AcrR family transcriptional regulator [Longispora urticae]